MSLQQEVGVCNGDVNGVGCAEVNNSGTMGNPNDLVNCYNITNFGGTAPFFLDTVRFWMGESISLPSDLSVRVWAGTVDGGASGQPLRTQNLDTYGFGENTVQLETPLEVATEEVCIGLFSMTLMDGLRVRTEPGNGDQSFVQAPACGADTFTSLEAFGISANFCMEAFAFA
jgi:hypothetical protein